MGLSQNLVSVIIPMYNVENFVKRCIDSIKQQSYSNIEIIVVYSDSSDNTLAVLEKYADQIKLVLTGKKRSPAIARNIGLKQAKGVFIAFCDADDFYVPEKIERQVSQLAQNPSLGLVYTDFVLVDWRGHELKRVYVPEWERAKGVSGNFTIANSSVMFRRSLLDKAAENGQYFDERLLACEDFDLLIRFSKIASFKRIPLPLTCYTIREGQLSKNITKTIIMENKVLLKHGNYSRIPVLMGFEVTKMVLTKVFKNPLIGFGLFHSDNR
jgi:glycosyltransferase involved in cell wall biosynthesis